MPDTSGDRGGERPAVAGGGSTGAQGEQGSGHRGLARVGPKQCRARKPGVDYEVEFLNDLLVRLITDATGA
jgi:hypothetical protein